MTVPRRFRHTELMLVRATTCPEGVTPPSGLDVTDPTALHRDGLGWLKQVWGRHDVREAVEMASPVLADRIDRILAANIPPDRRLRRAVTSMASYMLRWERRATPFGMFAGVTTAALGPASVKIGPAHQPVVRADTEWITRLIDQIEQDPAVRTRLTVVTDNAGIVRDGRFIVARRAELGARSPGPLREASVRLTAPIEYAFEQSAAPLSFTALAERISRRFPAVSADRIHQMIHGLIDGGFLITGLRPASTTWDPLDHLVRTLRATPSPEPDEQAIDEGTALLDQLEEITAQITQQNTTTDREHAARLRAAVTSRMRALQPRTAHALATDLELDARIALPQHVAEEAERAADVLLRLSAQPFGTAAWMDYHARFRARYGVGALVPVQDLLADSGLGYPHGYLGASRARPAWRTLTDRDAALLSLVQRSIVDGAEEITLSDADMEALTVGDHTEVAAPPRVELGVALCAASPEAIDRGDFELRVVAAPRAHTSMVGRFAHLLEETDRVRLARSYATDNAVAAQLSFPPRRPHNNNVVRVAPHYGTVVLSLSEHPSSGSSGRQGVDRGAIGLKDLAITADADQMYLVQRSTGHRVVAHVPHALDTTVQSPPLARFLAEVADARSAVFGPLDLGAARTLPYVPRIRYRRTVLSPARWLFASSELPAAHADLEVDLRRWRDRWKAPARVVAHQGELRLPLDLDQPLDRQLLRAHLADTELVELREDAPPGSRDWIGCTAELVIPMTATAPPSRQPPPTAPPATVRQPGDATLLRARCWPPLPTGTRHGSPTPACATAWPGSTRPSTAPPATAPTRPCTSDWPPSPTRSLTPPLALDPPTTTHTMAWTRAC